MAHGGNDFYGATIIVYIQVWVGAESENPDPFLEAQTLSSRAQKSVYIYVEPHKIVVSFTNGFTFSCSSCLVFSSLL